MLVAFVQEGTHDVSPYINADKTVNGDAALGEALYEECAECHGDDGKAINFGDEGEPEFVGTIANDNPWEFFHKVINGQPGTDMLSGINMGWSLQDIADILSFAQSLPEK
jgi:thiosulfate dehydrogenase